MDVTLKLKVKYFLLTYLKVKVDIDGCCSGCNCTEPSNPPDDECPPLEPDTINPVTDCSEDFKACSNNQDNIYCCGGECIPFNCNGIDVCKADDDCHNWDNIYCCNNQCQAEKCPPLPYCKTGLDCPKSVPYCCNGKCSITECNPETSCVKDPNACLKNTNNVVCCSGVCTPECLTGPDPITKCSNSKECKKGNNNNIYCCNGECVESLKKCIANPVLPTPIVVPIDMPVTTKASI